MPAFVITLEQESSKKLQQEFEVKKAQEEAGMKHVKVDEDSDTDSSKAMTNLPKLTRPGPTEKTALIN